MTPLTPQQEQVLALLVQGTKAADAAEQAGVHRNTVSNWRRFSPGFQHALVVAQCEQATYWRAQIVNLGNSAVQELKSILVERSSSLTLRAAIAVIDRIIKLGPAQPALPAGYVYEPEPDAALLPPPHDLLRNDSPPEKSVEGENAPPSAHENDKFGTISHNSA